MKTENYEFTGCNGRILPAMLWLPEVKPKAILQITHGMTEYIGRYTSLAEELTDCGIAVAGFDLRGHGKNPGDSTVASLGEDGWQAAITDMKCFFDVLEACFAGTPHYLHSFSLGSFLLREYLGIYPEGVAGAVLMGTGNQPGWLLSVMMGIVKGQIIKSGIDGTTELVRMLSFGAYNQKFKPNRTTADWLCADTTQLDNYLADPLVRKDISAGLFWQLLGSMKRTGKQMSYDKWNKEMPILLICGANDPVGDMGKGSVSVKKQMEAAGVQNITYHLLPEARHMILCEEVSGTAKTARNIICQWLLD